jgi:hypothetical protein
MTRTNSKDEDSPIEALFGILGFVSGVIFAICLISLVLIYIGDFLFQKPTMWISTKCDFQDYKTHVHFREVEEFKAPRPIYILEWKVTFIHPLIQQNITGKYWDSSMMNVKGSASADLEIEKYSQQFQGPTYICFYDTINDKLAIHIPNNRSEIEPLWNILFCSFLTLVLNGKFKYFYL